MQDEADTLLQADLVKPNADIDEAYPTVAPERYSAVVKLCLLSVLLLSFAPLRQGCIFLDDSIDRCVFVSV